MSQCAVYSLHVSHPIGVSFSRHVPVGQTNPSVSRTALNARETESHLVVCDPDGKNQKTIASEKAQSQWQITLAGIDCNSRLWTQRRTGTSSWARGRLFPSSKGESGADAKGLVTFGKDKITLKGIGGVEEGTYEVNSAKEPKWIDVSTGDKKLLGIYELDGGSGSRQGAGMWASG